MSRQEYSESYLGFGKWHVHGEDLKVTPAAGQPKATYNGIITTAADAADFAVTARDNASVEALADAKKVISKPHNGIGSIEFRFRFNGIAGDQHVLQCFAGAGVDFYRYWGQLTIDQGTQQHTAGAAGTGIWFIDIVLPANEEWHTAQTELSDASNHMGGYTMNTHRYDRFWFVASTLDTANAGTTLYIDWKQL